MLLINNNMSLELEWESPTSSPPTPPSPLPISYGAGNRKYSFSASSTSSPPFSTPASAENLSLLHLQKTFDVPNVPSVFSVDRHDPPESESKSTCLKDLLAWFINFLCSNNK
ncbi:unnamed protein product [Trifolium pratense]|uniref:Uncharacterized protein n=1 Tax=Trifolium pratense TaxID=57577 RepID=A0ACB0M039_TRIPR|nr:unnamed protein product [Trifolium pratense]